ncbi:hypothetical protein HK098_002956 [Nowakowskiella sp. JEL0407]|nr:hypothetical protein HK098_002956 [Nowakowskiella sp. JEL0407]
MIIFLKKMSEISLSTAPEFSVTTTPIGSYILPPTVETAPLDWLKVDHFVSTHPRRESYTTNSHTSSINNASPEPSTIQPGSRSSSRLSKNVSTVTVDKSHISPQNEVTPVADTSDADITRSDSSGQDVRRSTSLKRKREDSLTASEIVSSFSNAQKAPALPSISENSVTSVPSISESDSKGSKSKNALGKLQRRIFGGTGKNGEKKIGMIGMITRFFIKDDFPSPTRTTPSPLPPLNIPSALTSEKGLYSSNSALPSALSQERTLFNSNSAFNSVVSLNPKPKPVETAKVWEEISSPSEEQTVMSPILESLDQDDDEVEELPQLIALVDLNKFDEILDSDDESPPRSVPSLYQSMNSSRVSLNIIDPVSLDAAREDLLKVVNKREDDPSPSPSPPSDAVHIPPPPDREPTPPHGIKLPERIKKDEKERQPRRSKSLERLGEAVRKVVRSASPWRKSSSVVDLTADIDEDENDGDRGRKGFWSLSRGRSKSGDRKQLLKDFDEMENRSKPDLTAFSSPGLKYLLSPASRNSSTASLSIISPRTNGSTTSLGLGLSKKVAMRNTNFSTVSLPANAFASNHANASTKSLPADPVPPKSPSMQFQQQFYDSLEEYSRPSSRNSFEPRSTNSRPTSRNSMEVRSVSTSNSSRPTSRHSLDVRTKGPQFQQPLVFSPSTTSLFSATSSSHDMVLRRTEKPRSVNTILKELKQLELARDRYHVPPNEFYSMPRSRPPPPPPHQQRHSRRYDDYDSPDSFEYDYEIDRKLAHRNYQRELQERRRSYSEDEYEVNSQSRYDRGINHFDRDLEFRRRYEEDRRKSYTDLRREREMEREYGRRSMEYRASKSYEELPKEEYRKSLDMENDEEYNKRHSRNLELFELAISTPTNKKEEKTRNMAIKSILKKQHDTSSDPGSDDKYSEEKTPVPRSADKDLDDKPSNRQFLSSSYSSDEDPGRRVQYMVPGVTTKRPTSGRRISDAKRLDSIVVNNIRVARRSFDQVRTSDEDTTSLSSFDIQRKSKVQFADTPERFTWENEEFYEEEEEEEEFDYEIEEEFEYQYENQPDFRRMRSFEELRRYERPMSPYVRGRQSDDDEERYTSGSSMENNSRRKRGRRIRLGKDPVTLRALSPKMKFDPSRISQRDMGPKWKGR